MKFFISFSTIFLCFNICTAQKFFEPTAGPYGGYVYTLSIDKPGNIYAGTIGGGIYRSSNNGDTWIQSGLQGYTVQAIAIDSSGKIYLSAYTADSGYFFSSTDYGTSWQITGQGGAYVLAIKSNGYVFAGRPYSGTLLRSIDRGKSWQQSNIGITDSVVQSLTIAANGDIVAGTLTKGIFRSTDNGQTWNPSNSGLPNSSLVGVRGLTVYAPSTLAAVVNAFRVYISTDNGASWKTSNSLHSVSILSLAFKSDGTLFAGGGAAVDTASIYSSSDLGVSWTRYKTLEYNHYGNSFINALLFNSPGQLFAGTKFNGILKSTDVGKSWAQANNGLSNTSIRILFSNNYSHSLLAVQDYDFSGRPKLFESTNKGSLWIELKSDSFPKISSIASFRNGHIITASVYGDFRSTDGGKIWKRIGDIGHIAFIKTNDHLFVGSNRSTDEGESWTTPLQNFRATNIFCYAECPNGDLLVGTDSSTYRSTDDGLHWVRSNAGVESRRVFSIISNSENNFYCETDSGLYHSTNNGLLWTRIITSTPLIGKLPFVINSLGHLFIAYDGVYRSTDNGSSWQQINSQLNNLRVSSLALDSNEVLFVGTEGNGVFRSVNSTAVIGEINFIPSRISLSQNYPNPFSHSSVIPLELPDDIHQTVSIKICDMLGNIVYETTVDSSQKEIAFDASHLAAGVYSYTVRAGTFSETKRMVVVK